LLEKALEGNSIVFLGTGAGKTYIATMLIKELGRPLRDGSNMKTIFLVPSVPLVKQQADFLEGRIHLLGPDSPILLSS
jgi:endoribonuclease Dicer